MKLLYVSSMTEFISPICIKLQMKKDAQKNKSIILILVITKGYRVRVIMIRGQNGFAPTLCFPTKFYKKHYRWSTHVNSL